MYWSKLSVSGSVEYGPTLIFTGNGDYKRPDIAVTVDGISHIAFEWGGPGLFHVKYVVLGSAGQVVRSVVAGDYDILGVDKYPFVTIEPNGNIDIVWNDTYNFSFGLYMARYTPGGLRLSRSRIKNGNNITWPTIAAPRSNWIWVLYQQPSVNVDRIMSYRGSDTADIVSPPPGPSRRPRVVGADNQPVYAVWEDWSTGIPRIVAGEWNVEGTYLNDDMQVSDSPAAATLPDIGTDGQGKYYVVWRDARHQAEVGGEIYLEPLPPVGLDVSVLSETTLNPLPGAEVKLLQRGVALRTLTTDSDGGCRFTGLETGEYTVLGFFAGHESGQVVCYVPEQGFGDVEIRVTTDMEVTGILCDAAPFTAGPDASQLPVRGATVELLQGEVVKATTTSSSRGRFLFNVTTPGEYRCRAGKYGPPIPGESADTLYTYEITEPRFVSEELGEMVMPTLTLTSKVVVMVHGWNSSGAVWLNSGFVSKLTQRGWTVVWDYDLPGRVPLLGTNGWASVEQQSGYLAGVITDRLAVSSFNIVAHSQGGLVSRYLIEHERRMTEPRVTKCITLATPHHGSPVAGDVVFLSRLIGSSLLPPLFNAGFQSLLSYFQSTYPAVMDLDSNSQLLRTLNQGAQDHHDWSGWCLPGFSSPSPESFLDETTSYAVLAGTDQEDDALRWISRLVLTGRGCVNNDGVVPVTSARFYGSGDVHNWVANEFGINVYHKDADRAVGIVQSTAVQDSVASWLKRNPLSWPVSHEAKAASTRDVGDWSRIAVLQIPTTPGVISEELMTIDTCDTLQVNWSWFEGSVDLALVSPQGAVVDSAAAEAMPGIEYFRDQSDRAGFYRIISPSSGSWTLRIKDVVAGEAQNALLWIEAAAAMRLDLAVSADTPAIFSDHTIATSLTGAAGNSVLGANVVATIVYPSQTNMDLHLLDDGMPPDAAAGDGIYSATLEMETTPGTTVIDVSATGSLPEPYVRRAVTSIGRGAMTDAGIADPGLIVTDFNGLAGCRVALRGTAINYGPIQADLAVKVIAENEMTVLYADTVTVDIGGMLVVETSHLPLASGQYRYRLSVWPVGDIGEYDWGDNSVTLVVDVMPPVTGVPEDYEQHEEPGVEELLQGLPARLIMAYPNPFNPMVTLKFARSASGKTQFEAYDIRGRLVWKHETELLDAGIHEVRWQGTDSFGRAVPSGLYMIRMHAGESVDLKKVILIR
ncbi:MAG: alpha/beta fold hydrolase [Deltaproteobacteria bacterium]|nr:alpha/beta fold hydrolase [Deltaproteobacteria bacterium]